MRDFQRQSYIGERPIQLFWRWKDWPIREQDWLKVIYVPDIYNQITQHPLLVRWLWRTSLMVCVCDTRQKLAQDGKTDLDTTSGLETIRQEQTHLFSMFVFYPWQISQPTMSTDPLEAVPGQDVQGFRTIKNWMQAKTTVRMSGRLI